LKLIYTLLISMILSGCYVSNVDSFMIESCNRSYFKPNTLQRGEDLYCTQQQFTGSDTVVLVVDPWIDNPTTHLNDYFGAVMESRLIPMVIKSVDLGIPVIVLTNDPSLVSYNSNIHPTLDSLVRAGLIELRYHTDDKTLGMVLIAGGVKNIIMCGFASNMCVLAAMLPLRKAGLKLFFIPEASAAVEFKDTWSTGAIHDYTSLIISQWLARLISFDEFMKLN